MKTQPGKRGNERVKMVKLESRTQSDRNFKARDVLTSRKLFRTSARPEWIGTYCTRATVHGKHLFESNVQKVIKLRAKIWTFGMENESEPCAHQVGNMVCTFSTACVCVHRMHYVSKLWMWQWPVFSFPTLPPGNALMAISLLKERLH